ncbi:MAG: LTA synthase family protein [Bacilli bacterium]
MNKKVVVPIWWLFWIIYLEFIYRIFIVGNFFTMNTLSVVLFSFLWIIFFSLITTLFKERVNRIITILILSFIILITLAQIVYFNFYNSIFSFFSLTTGTGQVMQFWQMIIDVILRIWYIFVLILVPYILFLIFNKKIVSYRRLKLSGYIITLLIGVISLVGTTIYIKMDNKGIYSLNRLIYSTHAPMLTIDKTGLFTMQAIDIYRYLFGFDEEYIFPVEKEETEKEDVEEEVKKIEYNKYDIDFDLLISNEKNAKVKKIHEYMKNVEPTQKNKYTGMFKDKNLIFITAEAFDSIAIDENITPTLYKMATEGAKFDNYYQPLYPVSTSDGEYLNVMSLIPKEGVWSFAKTGSLDMKFAIGNMFKNNNYLTLGYHNHHYKYYDRHKSHPNIGLKYMGCKNGLEKIMNCNRWPNSDNEMLQATLPSYINSTNPFMVYYMTVSGHLNYNFYGNNMASRHKNEVKNLKYSDAVKAYYATQIELDLAMKYLIDELTEKGILEDTVIIIAPDHYPYGLSTKELNEVSLTDRGDKFEKFHTSLLMYNPKLNGTYINDTISGLDILPTIYNLFGIEYDSRFYMGKDIFSEDEHIVILSDRSWITSKGKYNSVTKEFIKTVDEDVPDDYIDNINMMVSSKFSVSASILDVNYFSKVSLNVESPSV